MFDLDAYLARLGLDERPGLADLHRAHVAAIPFENLDPRRGVPVSLELEDLQRKLVANRRGGYCFEQNLLLKAAFESVGARVAMYLARVRMGGVPGTPRPRTHLALGVSDGDVEWHADVGFGNGTLLDPIPFGPGGEYEQAGWRFRVVQDGSELVLQSAGRDGDWIDLYGFIPEAVPFVDVVTSNWYTCTHPRSPFVTGLIVSTQGTDGERTSLSDWSGELTLTEETPDGATVTAVEPDAVPEMIANRFGLEAALV
jgi:N-hydroxyarylamine O-acetyltransferase